MKKLILITLLVLLIFPVVYCESTDKDADLPDLIPYRKGDKWGFCDKDKNIVIECKYEDVELFSNGCAQVCQLKSDFSCGLGSIRFYPKWGFIDKKG